MSIEIENNGAALAFVQAIKNRVEEVGRAQLSSGIQEQMAYAEQVKTYLESVLADHEARETEAPEGAFKAIEELDTLIESLGQIADFFSMAELGVEQSIEKAEEIVTYIASFTRS